MRIGGLRNKLITDSLGWICVDCSIVGFDVEFERSFGGGVGRVFKVLVD